MVDAIDWVDATIDATNGMEATVNAKLVDPILSREASMLNIVEEVVDAMMEEIEVMVDPEVVDSDMVDSDLVDFQNKDLVSILLVCSVISSSHF